MGAVKEIPEEGLCALTVVVTCYNEAEYVVNTVRDVVNALCGLGHSFEVLVIDDASQDDSARRIEEYISQNPDSHVRLHVNETNRGLANNVIDGALMGRGKYFRFCCGDNAEPQKTLESLFRHLGKADLIVPYRDQKRIVGRSVSRRLLSRIFTFLVNAVGGYHIKYFNGSAIFLRRNLLRYPPVSFGFGFQADCISRMLEEGCTYMQVPLEGTVERKEGNSTALSCRNLLSVGHTLLEIWFRRIRRILFHKEMPRAEEIQFEGPPT